MLEKKKGLILGKLKATILMKGSLQILVKQSPRAKHKEIVQDGEIFLHANYNFRKGYSIENTMLEKC